MSRKTQRYSKEFKAEAVRTVLENQLSISEGASYYLFLKALSDNGLPPPEKGSVLLVPARWLNWNLKFCNCVRR